MRIVIDRDRCESNGVCVSVAPELFALDEDDQLGILQETVPDALRRQLEEAVRLCPMNALCLEERL